MGCASSYAAARQTESGWQGRVGGTDRQAGPSVVGEAHTTDMCCERVAVQVTVAAADRAGKISRGTGDPTMPHTHTQAGTPSTPSNHCTGRSTQGEASLR